MNYLAHIAPDRREQTVAEHLMGAAEIAAGNLEKVGLEDAAYLAGLLHDMGKYTRQFQNYLRQSAAGEPVRRGSVNHTFAAVKYLLSRFHNSGGVADEDIYTELLAYAMGAHHGQFDCVDQAGKSGFDHRRVTQLEEYEQTVAIFHDQCATEKEIKRLFDKAGQGLWKKLDALSRLANNGEEFCFYVGLLTRLLLSAVIEGDRRDTMNFMTAAEAQPPRDMRAVWKKALTHMEKRLNALPCDSSISQARRILSEQCSEFGDKPSGIYRLNLPTGAGKTLSSLRAALSHSLVHNKSRVIFTIPLLSVIDQNAGIIRDYIGDDDLILEHHSDVLQPEDQGELQTWELLTESWESPVIITTLVQLLNTMFHGRTSCVRRFHSLCDSVIIIDEVQTVPVKLLSLFNLTINFLAEVCGATVILCSATQPCLEWLEHPMRIRPEPVARLDAKSKRLFRRTRVEDGGSYPLERIGEQLLARLQGNMLLVCNTRGTAAEVYGQLAGIERYHLSASLCMAHRRDVLKRIEEALKEERSFICVSTQVIEAGVDVSFNQAVRLTAGLDSVLQTAGRCNRNRESREPAPVWVLQCSNEKLRCLDEIKRAQISMAALLEEYAREPGKFQQDLSSDEAVAWYYHHLYANLKGQACDGPTAQGTLFRLLSQGIREAKGSNRYFMSQAFSAAGSSFHVFDEDTVDVLVPYGEGQDLIQQLGSEKVRRDLQYAAGLIRRTKPYTVSLYRYQREILEKQGALTQIGGVLVLQDEYYDAEALGLRLSAEAFEFKEV